MKKTIFGFIFTMAVLFMTCGCGNTAEGTAVATDSTDVVVVDSLAADTVVFDSLAVDSTVVAE